jgi:hypothetical protein
MEDIVFQVYAEFFQRLPHSYTSLRQPSPGQQKTFPSSASEKKPVKQDQKPSIQYKSTEEKTEERDIFSN